MKSEIEAKLESVLDMLSVFAKDTIIVRIGSPTFPNRDTIFMCPKGPYSPAMIIYPEKDAPDATRLKEVAEWLNRYGFKTEIDI